MQIFSLTKTVFLTGIGLLTGGIVLTAQEKPGAVFVESTIEVCEYTGITTKLQFTGEPTFSLYYLTYNITANRQEGGINILNIVNIETDQTAEISFSNPDLTDPKDNEYEIRLVKISNNDFSDIDLSTTPPLKIISYKKPMASISAPELICGNQVTLTAIDNRLRKPAYHWATTWSGSFNSDNQRVTQFTTATPGNVLFTLTETNGECVSTAQKNIDILGYPTGTISGAAVICTAASNPDPKNITIQLNFEGVAPFQYLLSTGNQGESATASTQLTLAQQGSNEITLVKLTDGNGCDAPASQLLGKATVTDRKPLPNAGPNDNICSNEYVLQGVRSQPANTVQWSCVSGDCARLGDFLFDTDIDQPTFQAKVNTTVVLRMQETNADGSACISDDEVSIKFDLPIQDVYAGADTTLYMRLNLPLDAKKKDWETGFWTISNTGTFDNPSSPRAVVSGLEFGMQTLTWTVSNGICTPVRDEIQLEVKKLTWPNGFSPNGDGVNDKLVILGADNIQNNNLTVYSATGKVIFSQDNYGWAPVAYPTGKASAGVWWDAEGVEDGFYYYIFKAEQLSPIKESLIIKRTKP